MEATEDKLPSDKMRREVVSVNASGDSLKWYDVGHDKLTTFSIFCSPLGVGMPKSFFARICYEDQELESCMIQNTVSDRRGTMTYYVVYGIDSYGDLGG